MTAKADAVRAVSQQFPDRMNAVIEGVMAHLRDDNAKKILGPGLSPLIGRGTLRSIVTLALYADVMRVVRDMTLKDGAISNEEVDASLALLSALADAFAKTRKKDYAAFGVLSSGNARPFLNYYEDDTGFFGYANQATRWAGIKICRHIENKRQDPGPLSLFGSALSEWAQTIAASDGVSQSERSHLQSLGGFLNIPYHPGHAREEPSQPTTSHTATADASPLYFIKRAETVGGPFPLDELKDGYRQGKLLSTDLYSLNADGPWTSCECLPPASNGPSVHTDRMLAAITRPPLLLWAGAGVSAALLLTLAAYLFNARKPWDDSTETPAERVVVAASTPMPFKTHVRTIVDSEIVNTNEIDTGLSWFVDLRDPFKKALRFTKRDVLVLDEPLLEPPFDRHSYGDLVMLVEELANDLSELALHACTHTSAPPPQFRIANIQTIAVVASDLPEHERVKLRTFVVPAAERFRDGVAALSQQDIGDAKKDYDSVVAALNAIAAHSRDTIPGSLQLPQPHPSSLLPLLRNSLGMEFRLVPAGEFMMGSQAGKGEGDEHPLHSVTIPQPFYIGTLKVSAMQYELFLGKNASSDDAPVRLTFTDAVKFCEALSNQAQEKAAGRRYRLPTEAEWEYACRAGSDGDYEFGGIPQSFVADNEHFTRLLARRSNKWGLTGMHQMSEREWVAGGYGPYSDAPRVDSSPTNEDLPYGVIRGGRSADRHKADRDNLYAFRLVAEPPSPADAIAASAGELASQDKLDLADDRLAQAQEAGASRKTIQPAAISLAKRWIFQADKLVRDKEAVGASKAYDRAVAAIAVAEKYGGQLVEIEPVRAHLLIVKALLCEMGGDRQQALTQLVEAHLRDPEKVQNALAQPGREDLHSALLATLASRVTESAALSDFDSAFAIIGDGLWIDPESVTDVPALKNSIGMDMRLIPGGTFKMGDMFGGPDESPRDVIVPLPFYIGTCEVTNGQWERVMGAAGSSKKPKHLPVDFVGWEEATAFCAKLSDLPGEQAMGRKYRLPTEEEWELACRAGTTTRWYFGNDVSHLGEYAWFADNAGGTVHAVAQKQPNAWGLYDMYGNLREWVAGASLGGLERDDIILRGGWWKEKPEMCRSASREVQSRMELHVDKRRDKKEVYAWKRRNGEIIGYFESLPDSGYRKKPHTRAEGQGLRVVCETSTLDTEQRNRLTFRRLFHANQQEFRQVFAKAVSTRNPDKCLQMLSALQLLPSLPEDLVSDGIAIMPLEHISKLPLQAIASNSIGMKLKIIPAGSFTMGDNKKGEARNRPSHKVSLTRPFLLGVFPVTNGQYRRVMGSLPPNPVKERLSLLHDDTAVVHVGWYDAVAFCRRMTELPEEKAAGRVYRLPTEAEWEYAFRAGTSIDLPFGPGDIDEYVWSKSSISQFLDLFPDRWPAVGQKKPNPWGLHDMVGYVPQWCSDWIDAYSHRDAVDPSGPTDKDVRPTNQVDALHDYYYGRSERCKVLRGGKKDYEYASYWRSYSEPDNRYQMGFRVAVSPSQHQAGEDRKPLMKTRAGGSRD